MIDRGIRFSTQVEIKEQGIGKDINLRVENIDLTNPQEWDELQNWLIRLRGSLVAMCNAPDGLGKHNNSTHQPRRSWDTRCSENPPFFEAHQNENPQ